MSLNRYTNNFRTPLEAESISGLSPTFGSDNPVLDLDAPKLDINGTELNVISRNINFSHTTGLTTFRGQVGIGTTLTPVSNLSTKLEIYGGGGNVVVGTLFDTTTALYLNTLPGIGWTDYNLASSAARNLIVNRPSTNQILFAQGNSTHAAFNASNYLILSSGGLGIGADNSATEYLLWVNGPSAFIGTIRLGSNPTGVGFGTTTFNPPYAIQQTMGGDDGWRIYGESLSTNTGSLILEVNDDRDGSEDIQFRNRTDYGTTVGVTTFLRLGQSANIMDSGAPLLIGTATSTGAWNQRLQVQGGASFTGTASSVGIGTSIAKAILHLGEGRAAANNAPLKFTPGTNLSTVEAGTVEFDGTTLNFTPNSSIGRAAIPITVYTSGQGTVLTAAGESNPQTLFPAANDTINLPIGTYYLDLNMSFQRGTVSTTLAQPRIRFAGGTTTISGTFSGISIGSNLGQLGSGAGITSSFILSSAVITTDNIIGVAATTPSATYVSRVSGILRVTTAGIFTPAYSLSANLTSAGTASSPSVMNHMVIQSLATSGSVPNVGLWT